VRIFIAAGGTGGHVFPSLCVAEKLRELGDHKVFFLGTRRGLEAGVVASRGFPVLYVSARGWNRRIGLQMFRMLGENFLGFCAMGWYFLWYRPQAFFAMGSYLSLLGGLWAKNSSCSYLPSRTECLSWSCQSCCCSMGEEGFPLL